MPKGYWIPQIDVSNPEGYKAYMAATPPAHEKYRGTALVRGGKMEVVEGRVRSRAVLREFPDYATALACYRSDEYQRAKPLRLPHSQIDFIIVEGYDGPQPQPPQGTTPPAAAAAKGYWIGQVDVDRHGRLQALHGGQPGAVRHIRRTLSGARRPPAKCPRARRASRIVVLEFPSYDAALACYRSPEYQAAKKLREGKAEFDLVIVEGYDGPKF